MVKFKCSWFWVKNVCFVVQISEYKPVWVMAISSASPMNLFSRQGELYNLNWDDTELCHQFHLLDCIGVSIQDIPAKQHIATMTTDLFKW